MSPSCHVRTLSVYHVHEIADSAVGAVASGWGGLPTVSTCRYLRREFARLEVVQAQQEEQKQLADRLEVSQEVIDLFFPAASPVR